MAYSTNQWPYGGSGPGLHKLQLNMDSSAKQWLAELENDDDPRALEHLDPLSMQQLAESLANELFNQPQEQQEEQHGYHNPSLRVLPFVGDINKPKSHTPAAAAIRDSFFSLTNGSSSSLNFSALEQQQDSGPMTKFCSPLSEMKRGGRRATSNMQEHTDKVSVLGSTIEYVHHLRERVKVLQDIQSMGSTQPPISDARSRAGSGDDGNNNEVEIKVEANLQGTTVLLRVVCPEKKGVLIKLLTELEKLGLSTMNTNVVPFADSSLNITITAQIDNGSCTTVELVKNLKSTLRNF
uniref:Plant bHLH transcription factor ACT-like domain-containing protein n=2 Tax=Oryza nivara TaxID=4536 RepID=A0A0E0INX2_ORYNI